MGFDQVGIVRFANLEEGEAQLQEWIEAGKHGSMNYLEDFKKRREDFFASFPDAKSVIVLGVNYFSRDRRSDLAGRPYISGRIARYAWGKDYHQVIAERHEKLIEKLKKELGEGFKAVSCVDTKPIVERFAGIRAGFGFGGKNTMLLSHEFGPWLFLSEIVTNLELEEDTPAEGSCGTCVKCQVECPTGALDEDYRMDARLCIAYLTIEHKGVIPRELRPKIKDWVFGCDECLTICPFTSKEKETSWKEFKAESGKGEVFDFDKLFNASSNRLYQDEYKGTALLRANRKQLMRNACIVLGNSKNKAALPYLEKAIGDPAPLVRLHAAWALGQFDFPEAQEMLTRRASVEIDPEVLSEIDVSRQNNN